MNGWGGRLALALVAGVVACTDDSTAPARVPTPTSVVLSPASLRFASLGETAQLTATVQDQNGQVMAGAPVAWVSAHPSVATVDGNGLVSAAGNGATNITVTAGTTATASVGVTVEQVAATIVLSPPPDSMAVGDSVRMDAEALDALDHAIADVTFEWSSSDTTIATVDQQGWVRARAAGAAEITVAAGTRASATATITALQVPNTIVLSAPPDSLEVGDSVRMSAEALDALGNPIPSVTFEWSSSDTTIATIDQQGWVRARVAGAVEITVKLGSLSASASVVSFLGRRRIERAALEAFYHATNGPEWRDNTNWLTDKPLGEWYGIRTDATGAVRWIDLAANGLSGRLPAELADLSQLQALLLWSDWRPGDELTGPIPPELGELANLTELNLGGHELTGEIPPELANLANLIRLDLGRNRLTGTIPVELGRLANLEGLYLGGNLLTGEIPRQLGNLTRLGALSLEGTELTGEIPPEIGNLAELQWLFLGANELTGKIPPALGNLTNLEILRLSGAAFSGPIPRELGRLSKLIRLDLAANHLTGAIPPELGRLLNLESLFLGENDLEGPIPPELGALSRLESLGLADNPLTAASIPPELGKLTQLKSLALHRTHLSGPIPPEIGNLTSLEVMYLGNDSREVSETRGLTGRIPSELGNLVNLRHVNIKSHSLTGPIPPELGRLANLESLTLHGYGITGSIPPELGNLAKLEWLDLSLIGLRGSIPPELGSLAKLRTLALVQRPGDFGSRGAGLTGPIPPELGKLANLRTLTIGHHALTGPIPPELGHLSNLESIKIGLAQGGQSREGIGLTGPIPPELGKLTSLKVLSLDSNRLSGTVPPQIGTLTELKELVISNNDLEGRVPDTFLNLDLDEFWWHANSLCLPATPEFEAWRGRIREALGPYCAAGATAAADGASTIVVEPITVDPLVPCELLSDPAYDTGGIRDSRPRIWVGPDGKTIHDARIRCTSDPPERLWPYR